tara:strand:+ start:441 stop:638 length:198 start_codon:yes stop_codon:yes gene_type:complete
VTSNDWLKIEKTPQNQKDRERIERDTAAFIDRGGKINHIPKGVSSWDEDAIAFMTRTMRNKKKRV